MAVYEYTAQDANGNKFSGIYDDADSIATLRRELAKMGDTLLKAKRKKTLRGKRPKIAQDEIVTFAYEFAGMCSAGLSIISSLETLQEQTENQSFKHVLSDVRQSVATGSTLKDAFEKHKSIFSDFFLGMVEAGECGGKVGDTLKMSAIYLEKRLDFKRKVKSAFAYPIIVGIICLVVINYTVIFVVPVFSKLYQQMHVPLPGPTQALIYLSLLFRGWWWAILMLMAGTALLFKAFSKNPYLKARWDVFKLNMPVFAKLNRMIIASRFIRTLAMLVSAGVSLVKALDVASVVANNSRVFEITRKLQESIEAGNSVADSLRDHDIFPPMMVQLAATGEEAGTLSEMLNKGVDFLDKDIERTLSSLVIKIEPALTVIMGAIVGFILVSVYLPMFDYMAHLK